MLSNNYETRVQATPETPTAGARWMKIPTLLAVLVCTAFASLAARAQDPPLCQIVRFSDVGWTDVTSTTALGTELLRMLGYNPTITVLSVPVTFTSMRNRDIDVFLGNWQPMQTADR